MEKQGIGYVVAASCQQRLFRQGYYDRVDKHAQVLARGKWRKLSCGQVAKGKRWCEWAFVPVRVPTEKCLHRGLLIRRSLKSPGDRSYYFAHARQGTPVTEIFHVAGSRWAIQECFENAQQETRHAHHEVRGWTSWYRHIALAMFAHAFLAVVRAKANPPMRRKVDNSPRSDPAHRPRGSPTTLIPRRRERGRHFATLAKNM